MTTKSDVMWATMGSWAWYQIRDWGNWSTFKTARSLARSAPISLPSKFFCNLFGNSIWSVRSGQDAETWIYIARYKLSQDISISTHPSDARIFTLATVCPGFTFLDNALPITGKRMLNC